MATTQEALEAWTTRVFEDPADWENHYGNVTCDVAGITLNMIIDTGATINAITEEHWDQLRRDPRARVEWLDPEKGRKVVAYASAAPLEVKARFMATLTTANYSRPTIDAEFYVIRNAKRSLLSKFTARELGVVLMGEEVDMVNAILPPEEKISDPFPIAPVPEIRFDIDKSITPSKHCYVRIPEAFKEDVERRLEKMIREDIIEKVEGTPEWVSSMNVVMKGPKDFRLTLNMKKANAAIGRQYHPIPTIESIRQQVGEARYFAKLDLSQAYYHLVLDEEARNMTCFMTTKGVYRYKRLVFGVVCAPEIFQKFMEDTLQGLSGVVNFIDDVLVFADTIEELRRRTAEVMTRLGDYNLKLNLEKCEFEKKEVTFLGHSFSREGINIDERKTRAVKSFRSPKTISELRSFLGELK